MVRFDAAWGWLSQEPVRFVLFVIVLAVILALVGRKK